MSAKQRRNSEETIGQRLARLRRERGLTQVEMAERLGLAQSNISDYERDVLRLHGELIVELANMLDVSTDELLGHRQPAKPSPVRNRKLLRRMSKLEELPKRDQQALLRTIDKFLAH